VVQKVLVLNGPNLNLLGEREPDLYGDQTLEDIGAVCQKVAQNHGLELDFRQSNLEGELVSWIQQNQYTASGIIINAAAYTHTSVALLDALLTCAVPVIEVHLTNIYQREEFRHNSYISRAARGVICGFGAHGYVLALDAMAQILDSNS